MRLIISASILSISCGSIPTQSNDGATVETKLKITQQVEASYTLTVSKGERFLGQECKPSTETDPDVGLLGCRNAKAFCEEDVLSSIGGRCVLDRSLLTPKVDQPIFTNRRLHLPQSPRQSDTPRFLQNSGWTCPTGCPKEFCKCAEKYGEVKECAKEMDNLCVEGLVSECVPGDYLPFYYQTYCPFAECLRTNNAYHDCSCQYYRDYCNLYYAFTESASQCRIASCCEAANSVDEKIECLPGLQPTSLPTMYPTTTAIPSGSPTVSAAPSVSPKPTVSPEPTQSPTDSHQPTVSISPTESPSALPSLSPTISFAPIVASDNPSASPSASFAPSVTHSPTNQPTVSSKPSVSSAPSIPPSVSVKPTGSPSDAPTNTFSPSGSPSTAQPTYKPTNKPTRRPTRKPTQKPTLPPGEQTLASTDAITGGSSGSSLKSTMTMLVGLAGATWFFLW